MQKLAASFSVLLCLAFLLPLTTQAQGTQYDTFPNPDISSGFVKPSAGTGFIPCSGTTCSPCHLVVLFNTVLKWFLTIAFLIFAVVALVAGIKLVTQGNPGALADAKKSFLNAFIGLIIILSAFLIVDTLMRYLVRDGGDIEGYGPWQEVKCATQTEAVATKMFDGDPEYEPGTVRTDPATYSSFTASTLADGTLRYQAGIGAQREHASPALATMITCMAGKMPPGVGEISSISDKAIVSGLKTWEQCRAGGCGHTARSYHYGNNGQCGNRSFAADFGDEQNISSICGAAYSCGQVSCEKHQNAGGGGSHVHLSVPVSC